MWATATSMSSKFLSSSQLTANIAVVTCLPSSMRLGVQYYMWVPAIQLLWSLQSALYWEIRRQPRLTQKTSTTKLVARANDCAGKNLGQGGLPEPCRPELTPSQLKHGIKNQNCLDYQILFVLRNFLWLSKGSVQATEGLNLKWSHVHACCCATCVSHSSALYQSYWMTLSY